MKTQGMELLHWFTRGIYTFLLVILLPLLLLLFKKKLKQNDNSLAQRNFSERFGRLPSNFKKGGIHIHCVSVGEINAASQLIEELIELYPNLPITLTTSSTTGAVHAYNTFKERVQHAYLPIDVPYFMAKFYSQIQASLVLITEVEIWPNQLAYCQQHGITTVLINARMTNKSLVTYKKLSWLFRPTLRQFDLICAQSPESFENFLSYGVYKSKLKLSRNMKFDLLPNSEDEKIGKALIEDTHLSGRPILLAGSTHSPEEKIVLEVYSQLKKEFSDLALIIVPRHPHRFDEAYLIAKASGVLTQKLSQMSEKRVSGDAIDCVVVDKMGMLKPWYSVCNLAFVGGSFAPKGGHNALEAAVYAKPIVMGPSNFNNPSICHYLSEQGALKIVDSSEAFYAAAFHWLKEPEEAKDDGINGSKVLLKNAGAVEYTLSVIRPYLSLNNK